MTGPPFEIRCARADEMAQVASTMTVAYVTDPFARFVWPSPHTYLRAVPLFIPVFAGASLERESAYVCADFRGAALWLPPGVHPDGEAVERFIRDTAPPQRVDDIVSTFEKMDQSHPQEPHWYLAVIGVEANAQGRGLGGALMRHALARCDEEGMPAYLESTNSRSVSFYERHGFKVIGAIQEGAFPVVTPMLRRPHQLVHRPSSAHDGASTTARTRQAPGCTGATAPEGERHGADEAGRRTPPGLVTPR
jgi:ribosomal protein S18 acetylase RimI-like enzyme